MGEATLTIMGAHHTMTIIKAMHQGELALAQLVQLLADLLQVLAHMGC